MNFPKKKTKKNFFIASRLPPRTRSLFFFQKKKQIDPSPSTSLSSKDIRIAPNPTSTSMSGGAGGVWEAKIQK